MKTIKALAATLTFAALSSLAAPALAAPAPAPAPATAGSADAAASADQLQGVKGSRLVFRNVTDKTLMLYSPDGGRPDNSREHYMATVSPDQEYTFSGYNTYGPNASDVYVRVYTVKKNPDTGAAARDTMVATVAAHNPCMEYPYVRVTAGKSWHEKTKRYIPNSRTMALSEHETHNSWKVVDDDRFRAWIHRDGDVDGVDYKTMKLTLQDIDTVPTLDFSGGGAAPA